MNYFTSSDFSFLFCKIKSIVLKKLPWWLNIIYVAIWEVAENTKTSWVESWLPYLLCGALDKLPPCFCIVTIPTEEIHHEDYINLQTNHLKQCLVYKTTQCCCCLVAQLCLTLCHLMDCSPPGSSVHGIFQARILEWVVLFISSVQFSPFIGQYNNGFNSIEWIPYM